MCLGNNCHDNSTSGSYQTESEELSSKPLCIGSLIDDGGKDELSSVHPSTLCDTNTAVKPKKSCPQLNLSFSWKSAMEKAKYIPDPWEKFHIDESCPMEIAIRHRYNAVQKTWVPPEEVKVKIEQLVSITHV